MRYTAKKLELDEVYRTDVGQTIDECARYAVVYGGLIVTTLKPSRPLGLPNVSMPEIYSDFMTAQKIADFANGKVMDLPAVYLNALKSAFKGRESTNHPGYYYVSDKCSEYLCKRLGLVTDWCERNIVDSFTVAFDWRLQRWMVSA